ncbi:MAG: transglycosylase domain-containing protein [Clostridia bacterium]|nr:transglycosylase domain-containing protein [Clostridia bacterium]
MKKRYIFAICLIFICVAILFSSLFCYLFLTKDTSLDYSKLSKSTLSVQMYDEEGNAIFPTSLKEETIAASLLPDYLKNAFIAVEDKRFYSHRGVDFIALLRAIKSNLSSKKIKQGGSTITQQLIKNTHLTSEKTLKRKLCEIKLARTLEKNCSKEQILEYYLNGIYFGNGNYGIQSAAKFYFGIPAQELSISQSACLAACINSPLNYNPLNPKCKNRRNLVLKLMLEQNFITEKEYSQAINEPIITQSTNNGDCFGNYANAALECALEHLNLSPYDSANIVINCYLKPKNQQILCDCMQEVNGGAIMLTPTGKVTAYFMPQGEYERPPASCIKPLLVYAPALEEGLINLQTPILDEKCTFGDYSPENYGAKYNGYVSVKQAIVNSLNVPAVKILQTVGVEKAKGYLQKLGITIEESGLNIALGGYFGGVKLTDLCAAYACFANGGNYFKPQFISSIYKNGKCVYQDTEGETRVFSQSTCALINDALTACSISGTAKAIGARSYPICAKTGTSGNKKGNTDCLTVCYSSTDVLGVWLGNKDNSLLPNAITGGVAARCASNILNELYDKSDPLPFEECDQVEWVDLCSLAYQNHSVMKAAPNQPKRYIFEGLFSKESAQMLPISDYFEPKLNNCNISVEKNSVLITFEKQKHVKVEIAQIVNGKKEVIASTDQSSFLQAVESEGKYQYILTPYVQTENSNKMYGESVTLPSVLIYSYDDIINTPWWEN